MSARIEAATLDDIPQLCELLQVLFAQEREFQPDAARQAAGLREIIEHPDAGQILLLREGGEVVAMVGLLYTVSTARGGRVAMLEDMVVRPGRRGSGAGSALLQAAIAHAQAAGCSRITLLTDQDNETAIRFYRRHGFEVSGMLPLRLHFPQ
ncbi:MAG: GNAT family N-acetyltransferase [Sideroxydans sp.]|nr:GNAT family N-acetyltransferase [Sideroxydans sp.]